MCSNNKPIIVIGHKNPDTDSICSAICYADLKSKITNETYIAKRAGHLNEETQYVLKKYDIKRCYYGHLHGNSHKDAINGDIGGINFSLISADYLNFKLLKIN